MFCSSRKHTLFIKYVNLPKFFKIDDTINDRVRENRITASY